LILESRPFGEDRLRVIDFLVKNWLLVLTAFVSGALLLWPTMKGRTGTTSVGPDEAVRLINREKAVLIDVSEPAEHAAGHPGGARHIPFGQIEGSKDLPSNKALPLLLVCPTGARSGKAVALLRKAGYDKAMSLAGGFAAWRSANLPVEKKAPA
jgi:rhodanese-related sulfurtransferase